MRKDNKGNNLEQLLKHFENKIGEYSPDTHLTDHPYRCVFSSETHDLSLIKYKRNTF
ncbi:MAG: hypothetical protein PVF73_12845 [Bacteroidales bacterium]|jgi:hypothetical protein